MITIGAFADLRRFTFPSKALMPSASRTMDFFKLVSNFLTSRCVLLFLESPGPIATQFILPANLKISFKAL
ncbi:MAG: hypothetical protein AMJ78_09750 [Omnitrophica WOR_2 bacterium SM23_29]|nr:MAG: hypothetical protein AMJ78_09750 [Omnitrophica WOR_2 bacterium SM23_29]